MDKILNTSNVRKILKFLNQIVLNLLRTFKRRVKLDIIFLDPPYREERLNFIIEKILKKNILNKNGIIIVHRHKKDNIKITKKLNIIDLRLYGISKIIFAN